MSVVGRVQINRPGATGPVNPPTPVDDPPVDPGDYLALIISDGAVAAWPLEESDGTAIYADVIGSINAVLNNGTTGLFAADPIGPALVNSPQFNGDGGLAAYPPDLAIVTAHDPLFEVGTGDFAMEIWMLQETFGPSATAALAAGLISANVESGIFGLLAGPGFGGDYSKFEIQDGGAATARSSAGFDDASLHHCVFTRRGGDYVIIIDGVQNGTVTPASPLSISPDSGLHFAGVDYGPIIPGESAFTLGGQLSWCAFYNVALSEAQAAAHYAAGA